MRTALLAMAIVGGALSAATQAQAPAMPPQPGYDSMGPNGNGDRSVTREAYLADAARRFARMDADHDGHLTQGERAAFREAMRDRQIADGATPPPPPPPPPPRDDHGDRGHGGIGQGGARDVTQQDYMARAAERFDRMDTNHDGRLDASEMASMRGMRRHDPRGDRTPPPPPPGGE